MRLNKRGITTQTALVTLIIALAVGIILFLATNTFTQIMGRGTDIEKCRLSILANAKARITETELPVVGGEQIAINCPKTELKLTKKDIEAKGALTKEDMIKRKLAEELRLCWYKTGEGKLKPFKGESGRFCLICSEIEFDKNVQEKAPEIRNFIKYLAETDMPKANTKYLDYLTGAGANEKLTINTAKLKWDGKKGITDKIKTSEKYSVIFAINKKGFWAAPTSAIGSALIGGAIGCKTSALLTAIPFVGWGTAAIICGGSIIGSAVGGYVLGTSLEDEYLTITLTETKNIPKMRCSYLYQ